jgi:hypothetical protein
VVDGHQLPVGAVRELTWTAQGALVAVLGGGVKIHVSRRRRAAFAAAVRAQADGMSQGIVLETGLSG